MEAQELSTEVDDLLPLRQQTTTFRGLGGISFSFERCNRRNYAFKRDTRKGRILQAISSDVPPWLLVAVELDDLTSPQLPF